MKAELPFNETARLQLLTQLQILDTMPEPCFDAITELANLICQTPKCAISLVDVDRQWFKARIELPAETPREQSFCAHAILTPDQMTIVEDATLDPRFNDNPLVTTDQGIRFYAGAPLILQNGLVIGALCVIDLQPRQLNTQQLHALRLLAQQTVALLEARLTSLQDKLRQQTLATLTENVPLLLAQLDPELNYLFCNNKYAQWFQLNPEHLIGKHPKHIFGDEFYNQIEPYLRQCLTGQQVTFVHTMPDQRSFDVRYIPQINSQGKVEQIIVIANDITESRLQRLTLQREKDRFEAVILGSKLGIYEWNIQTGETIHNENWFNLIGREFCSETTVELWQSLVHPEDLKYCQTQLKLHFQQPQSFYDVTFRMRHLDGHWVWIHAIGKVMSWTDEGQPLLMFGTHADVSAEKQQDLASQDNRSWLQAMIDSSTEVALIASDIQGNIVMFNTGAERMLGYQAAELIGQSPAVFHLMDEVQRRGEQLSAEYQQEINGFEVFVHKARRGTGETRQWTYVCKNGTAKQVRLSVSAVRGDDAEIRGFLGVAIDITQLEQLHHALLLSEQRHRSMLENLPGVVYRCINDAQWTMLFISDEVERLTGYKANQFIRNKHISFDQLTLEEDMEIVRQQVELGLTNRSKFSVEYRIRHADGSLRWIQELGRGIYDQDNSLMYIDGFIWDVTSQRLTQQALDAGKLKLNSLYQLAPLAILLSEYPDGQVVSANPQLCNLLGAHDALNLPPLSNALLLTSAEQQYRLEQLATVGRYGPAEHQLKTKLQQSIPVVLNEVKIESADGAVQVWSILQDITESKRIETMKNQFVSTVSHELRTPLTAISGALGLVSGGALGTVPDLMQNMLNIAKENSLRLTQLINDLLDIDKLVAGKVTFDLQLSSIFELLQQAVTANQPYANNYQVKIELMAEQDIQLLVDPRRFHQILANLLSNAAKFSPAGSTIQVKLSISDTQVQIEVKDQGPGIPLEFQQHIFEKFSQADSADARSKGGTGLGLAIVKELTSRMHGEVSFNSVPNQGTSFYLKFPVPVSRDNTAPNQILVVEDERHVASYIQSILEKAGYMVTLAHNLAEANTALLQQPFTAISLDLTLPDGHAAALITALRSKADTEHLPILIISASKSTNTSLYAGYGFIDWLEKPIDEQLLLKKLKRLLQ